VGIENCGEAVPSGKVGNWCEAVSQEEL